MFLLTQDVDCKISWKTEDGGGARCCSPSLASDSARNGIVAFEISLDIPAQLWQYEPAVRFAKRSDSYAVLNAAATIGPKNATLEGSPRVSHTVTVKPSKSDKSRSR
jgi:hypothetical protein